MKRVYFIVLFIICLTGCATPTHATSSSAYPSETPTLMVENITPSRTPKPILTFTSTLTPNPRISIRDASLEACDGIYRNNSSLNRILSPNGQWTAVVCRDDGIYTKISRIDNNVVWKLPVTNIDSMDWYLYPYHWSNDEKFLYLSSNVNASMDCPECFYIEGFDLYRLNLLTGNLEALISGNNFSISPDEKYLAFVDSDNSQIVSIRDLLSGQEIKLNFKEKYTDLGRFVWTKDSSELLILAGVVGWRENTAGYSLLLYNLRSNSVITLIDNDLRQLSPASGYVYEERIGSPWLSTDLLLLGDPLLGGDAWTVNIRTGEITSYATPVVTPTYNP